MAARLRKHLPLTASLFLPGVAVAHSSHLDAPALLAGLLHPFSGVDHIMLMLGVGLWASWLLRHGLGLSAVSAATALGVLWGAASGGLPALELLLAGSLVIMGGVIAGVLHTLPTLSVLAVMMLAALHGYAHGVEMTPGTSLWHYLLGILTGSLTLQLIGLTLGQLGHKRLGERRGWFGLPLAAAGIWLLFGTA
ncbi:MAG: HupE/UreJ family protein [Burkholderiales bacterium]|nr:HupE/UreJ family protein [Burkholderiales bacterium]